MSLKNEQMPLAPPTKIQFQRSEDFLELYANHTQLSSSLWDLRIIFGQTEPTVGEDGVLQHASVRLPWPQAKVLAYFLLFHIKGEELEHGRIVVAPGIIPEVPATAPKQLGDKSPELAKSWNELRKLYEDFIGANPEAK